MFPALNLHSSDYFMLLGSGAHGVMALTCLVLTLLVWNNPCLQLSYLLLTLTGSAVVVQVCLWVKFKKANLFDPKIRRKFKRILTATSIPMFVNMFLSVVWWGRSDLNPPYCVLVSQMELSPKLGILYELYALYLGSVLVSVLHQYTRRKFFLIAIGGPENEVHRDDPPILPNLQLIQQALNPPEYNPFEDAADIPHIQILSQPYIEALDSTKQCYICLEPLSQDPTHKVIRPPCQHTLHSQCGKDWIQCSNWHQCPLCKTPFHP